MESDAARVHVAHHAHDVLDVEGVTHRLVAHAAPRRVLHLEVLQMKGRARKQIEVTDVIVMQVRDDDVLHALRFDAHQRKRILDRAHELALAAGSRGGVESRINDEFPFRAAHEPDEVVERHRSVMRVAAKEILAGGTRVVRVLDRVDFVRWRAHSIVILANLRLPTWATTVVPDASFNALSATFSPSSFTPPCSIMRAASETLGTSPACLRTWAI